MNSKLPNVFHNRKAGVIKNNKEVYYSKETANDNKPLPVEDDNIKKIIIKKKINDIFSSKDFIYKAKAIISTKDGDREVVLIHKNNNALLTIDNESIPISDIIDIKKI